MNQFEAEFARIRAESKEDFKFTMIALSNVTATMENLSKSVSEAMAAMGNEMNLVKAKIARQEDRFELMLDVVQREMKAVKETVADNVKRSEMADVQARLEARLEALERRLDSAA